MFKPVEPSAPWRPNRVLGENYDVVIVGGGIHALALAYYLSAVHSIDQVAVLAKGSIFGSSSMSPLLVVEPQSWWAAGAELSLRTGLLYQQLGSARGELGLVSEREHLVLARTNDELNAGRWRTELSKAHGAAAETIDGERVRKLLPELFARDDHPIVGGQLAPGGGVLRLDLAMSAYASGAFDAGVHLFEGMPPVDVVVTNGRVAGVRTADALVRTPIVVACAPGWASIVGEMAGVPLPLVTRRQEMILTEPSDHVLPVVVRGEGQRVSVAQTEGGAVFVSGPSSSYGTYSSGRSYQALDQLASGALGLLPTLERARVGYHWSAPSETATDDLPIVGPTSVDGFLCSAGWGGAEAALGPAVASELATGIAQNTLSPLLQLLLASRLNPKQQQLGLVRP